MADIVGGSIVWNLDANLDKLNSGLDSAEQKVNSLKGKMKEAGGGSRVFAAGLAVVGAATVAFGVSSVNAFNEAQMAQTKLATNLLNVKGNTMANVDALSDLATHLQSVGVIQDDTIKAGMSQLATFNLQGKTIATLTPKITDMVAQLKGHNATAEDMVAINNLVGKVMTGNVGALSRYGVTLDDNQAKLLKQGTESERAAVLTQVLAQNYGKVNEALRNTPQGQITAFKNTFNDFQEKVGEAILKGLTPFVKGLNDLMKSMGGPEGMMRKFNGAIDLIVANLPIIAGLIIGGLTPAVFGLASGFIALMGPLVPFIVAGVVIGALIKLLNDRFDLFGKGLPILIGILAGVGGVIAVTLVPAFIGWAIAAGSAAIATIIAMAPLILLGLAIAAVVAIIVWLAMNWDSVFKTIVSIVKDAYNWIKGTFDGIVNAAKGLPNAVWNAISSVKDFLIKPFVDAWNFIKGIIDKIRNELDRINPFHRESPSLVDNVTRGLSVIKDQFSSLGDIDISPIAHTFIQPDFSAQAPMNVLGNNGAQGSPAPAIAPQTNIYIEEVNNMQTIEALRRELGFKQGLTK